jgi:Tol biopolymer transport system component
MSKSINPRRTVFSSRPLFQAVRGGCLRTAAAAACVAALAGAPRFHCNAAETAPSAAPAADAPQSPLEQRFLTPPVPVTAGMPKAGEGYFAPDMRRICYQAVPDGYPFYQIFIQPFDAAGPRPATPVRISPGRGRTTCSWFSPDGKRLLFASSHLDPGLDATESAARAQAEEDRRTGRRRRYQWDFDPHMDIFSVGLSADGAAGDLVRLTNEAGYDAECSYSPDGGRILFVSDRDGDPDIYVMDADGRNVRQLTNAPGYDGGPFFSPDGRWIAYRTDRVEKDMLQIHVMRADGSGDVAVTSGQGVRWAPYWHPTKPWLIWTGADHSDPTKRPNYDLWIARYDEQAARGDAAGRPFSCGAPVRITDQEGADVLPAFSPDGSLLMWTASRGGDGGGRAAPSQLWASRLDTAAVEAAFAAGATGAAADKTER